MKNIIEVIYNHYLEEGADYTANKTKPFLSKYSKSESFEDLEEIESEFNALNEETSRKSFTAGFNAAVQLLLKDTKTTERI